VDETSALHRKVYKIVTYTEAFTVKKLMYEIKQLGCTILKFNVKKF